MTTPSTSSSVQQSLVIPELPEDDELSRHTKAFAKLGSVVGTIAQHPFMGTAKAVITHPGVSAFFVATITLAAWESVGDKTKIAMSVAVLASLVANMTTAIANYHQAKAQIQTAATTCGVAYTHSHYQGYFTKASTGYRVAEILFLVATHYFTPRYINAHREGNSLGFGIGLALLMAALSVNIYANRSLKRGWQEIIKHTNGKGANMIVRTNDTTNNVGIGALVVALCTGAVVAIKASITAGVISGAAVATIGLLIHASKEHRAAANNRAKILSNDSTISPTFMNLAVPCCSKMPFDIAQDVQRFILLAIPASAILLSSNHPELTASLGISAAVAFCGAGTLFAWINKKTTDEFVANAAAPAAA